MVRRQQDSPVGKLILRSVAEHVSRSGLNDALSPQGIQVGVESNLAQRNYNFDLPLSCNLTVKKERAVRNFFRERLIVRRGAPNCGGDVCVVEFKPIVA